MKKLCWLALVAGLALGGGGCAATITEADRQLVYQNKYAGMLVEEKASEAEIRQAGKDIRLNSEALEKSIGLPKQPTAYSPQASAATREARDVEHKPKWWQLGLSALVGLLGGGGLLGIVRKVFPTILAGPLGTAAVATFEAISRIKTAKDEQGKISLDVLMRELAQLQADAGVREVVKSTVKKIEDKIKGT